MEKWKIDLSGSSPWKDADKEWFAANPTRSFRIRRLFAGEFPSDFSEGQTHVLVRQLRPGLRDKLALLDARNGADFDRFPDDDAACMMLWERLERRDGTFSLAEVITRTKVLASTTKDGGRQ